MGEKLTISVDRQSSEETGRLGEALYGEKARYKVEAEPQVGKMIIIHVETGDFEIDEIGPDAARGLHMKRPGAALFGKRIGYKSAEFFGGVVKRTASRIGPYRNTVTV